MGGYRAPIVAMEHGYLHLIPHLPARARAMKTMERRASVPFIDAEVPVSDYMSAVVRGAPHARHVERIHNGLDLTRFAPTPVRDDGCTIGCATRCVPGKGLDVLLRAFARMDVPGTRLTIAGHGPLRDDLIALAGSLGITDVVDFPGVVADMPRFWAEVDVAVLPSTAAESFGMSALEAMATARPVVATRNGGYLETVADGETGRLVAMGDVDELATAMTAYAMDAGLRREHGAAGRLRCEQHFDLRARARDYTDLVGRLADERAKTTRSRGAAPRATPTGDRVRGA
jgi:glycosyltransferase involved in cell wall biosynthesis